MTNTHKSAPTICAVTFCMFSSTLLTPALAGQPQQCETPYADNGIAETTIVYQIDKQLAPGDFFIPIDADRDTTGYRTRAFAFFNEQFGVELEASGFAPQPVFDGVGGSAFATGFRLTPGATQQVVAIDSQNIPQLSGLFPLNNVAMIDDGYAVVAGETGFTVFGEYGGGAGVWLPPNSVLIFGEYRMIDGDGDLIDTLEYRSEIPAFQPPVPGASDPTLSVLIRCEIRSALFGNGNTHGLGTAITFEDGSTSLETRYIMRFPKRIAAADPENPHCDRAKALPPAQYSRYADE